MTEGAPLDAPDEMAPGSGNFDNMDDDLSLATMGSVVTMGSGPVFTNLQDVEINVGHGEANDNGDDNRSINFHCEYETYLPITPHGLLILLKNKINGTVEFDGYARKPDGSMGPAETDNLIRNRGDVVVKINGCTLKGLQFSNVLGLLQYFVEQDKTSFVTFKLVDCVERDALEAATKPKPALEIVAQGFKDTMKHVQQDLTKGVENVQRDIKRNSDLVTKSIPKGLGIFGASIKKLNKLFSSSSLSKHNENDDDRSTGTNETSNSSKSGSSDKSRNKESLEKVQKKFRNILTGKKAVRVQKVLYAEYDETAEYIPRFGRRL